ncbi:hypothetical protein CSUI_008112, partial [Cystoisospora suis]
GNSLLAVAALQPESVEPLSISGLAVCRLQVNRPAVKTCDSYRRRDGRLPRAFPPLRRHRRAESQLSSLGTFSCFRQEGIPLAKTPITPRESALHPNQRPRRQLQEVQLYFFVAGKVSVEQCVQELVGLAAVSVSTSFRLLLNMTRTIRDKEAVSKLEHHAGSKARALDGRSHKSGSGKFNWGHIPDMYTEPVTEKADAQDPMFDSDGGAGRKERDGEPLSREGTNSSVESSEKDPSSSPPVEAAAS